MLLHTKKLQQPSEWQDQLCISLCVHRNCSILVNRVMQTSCLSFTNGKRWVTISFTFNLEKNLLLRWSSQIPTEMLHHLLHKIGYQLSLFLIQFGPKYRLHKNILFLSNMKYGRWVFNVWTMFVPFLRPSVLYHQIKIMKLRKKQHRSY